MASDQYHEPIELLDEKTQDLTRIIKSIMEEFEAVDWYNQRMSATKDQELRDILKHNRDEELEHAAMGIEWLRRQLPEFDAELRENLFKEGPIGHHDDEDEESPSGNQSLNIGKLKR
ncbi:MAG: encapsulin-associated ferritin-like protein [Candidatus Izemoplasmataceae bacterium]